MKREDNLYIFELQVKQWEGLNKATEWEHFNTVES